MRRKTWGRACAGAALILAVLLVACSTSQVIAPPVPAPRETPINSLALEQCVGENGAEKCAAEGQ